MSRNKVLIGQSFTMSYGNVELYVFKPREHDKLLIWYESYALYGIYKTLMRMVSFIYRPNKYNSQLQLTTTTQQIQLTTTLFDHDGREDNNKNGPSGHRWNIQLK